MISLVYLHDKRKEEPARLATSLKWSEIVSFLLVLILTCAAKTSFSQQTHVLLNDERVLVTTESTFHRARPMFCQMVRKGWCGLRLIPS